MQTHVEVVEHSAIETKNGGLRGLDLGTVVVFKGIPYARPPVGALRWAPPQPCENWSGVREAIADPPQCAQNRYLGVFAKPGGQEDCLYLNVWRPKAASMSGRKLPVMVWIHGGALWVGSANDYDGGKLAAHGQAIVVTINYRLAMLGMFAHPSLIDRGEPWGNFGLMDQQAALKWVQDNIAAFGGDPDNVTIFGESSGGTSVLAHVVSPASRGLFHHAVDMSGSSPIIKYPHFGCTLPSEQAIEKGVAFAEAAGCDGSIESLRALPIERILEIQTPHLSQQFFVDGHTIPATYTELIRSGKVNGKTFTGGVTRDEWTWAAGFTEIETGSVMSPEAYAQAIMGFYGEENGPKVLAEYPVSKYGSGSEAFGAAVTASLFAAPMHRINEWLSEWMPVFAYEFCDKTAPSYLQPTTFALGAAHTSELAYLFPGFHGGDGVPTKLNPLQEQLSDHMVRLFTRTPEANGARLPDWPRYDPKSENYLSFVLPEPRQSYQRFSQVHNTRFWDDLGIY